MPLSLLDEILRLTHWRQRVHLEIELVGTEAMASLGRATDSCQVAKAEIADVVPHLAGAPSGTK